MFSNKYFKPMICQRSKHVALHNIYLVVLTVYLHNNLYDNTVGCPSPKLAGIHFHNMWYCDRNQRNAELSHGEKNLENSNELRALYNHSSESDDDETVVSVTGMRTPQCLQFGWNGSIEGDSRVNMLLYVPSQLTKCPTTVSQDYFVNGNYTQNILL
jgi:hypothetical protein